MHVFLSNAFGSARLRSWKKLLLSSCQSMGVTCGEAAAT